MPKLLAITKSHDKVVFINPTMIARIDVLRYSDGFWEEVWNNGLWSTLSWVAVRKPMVVWFAPLNDSDAQAALAWGYFRSVPFPHNDHNSQPNAAQEALCLDYGPLFTELRGRTWVLTPHVISVASKDAIANMFEVDNGYVIPVVNGKTVTAKIVLRKLARKVIGIDALQPGNSSPVNVVSTTRGDSIDIDVPLSRGCALIRLNCAPR